MTTKKTDPQEAVAMAKFVTTGVKPELVSGATTKVSDVVKQNPAYPQHPEIQTGLTSWTAAADAVDQTSQKIKAAHLALTALIATLPPQMAAWKRYAHAMVALINTACAGSASAIQQWGFAVSTRNVLATTSEAPSGLRVTYNKAFTMSVRWKGVRGHLGYLLQIGDGTPQGWGPSIQCPRASYLPQGITPGAKVAFRVAVQRKNGVSVWSDALIVTAR
jgi:hypothetical protein